jgi:hypothetical protein
MSAALLGGALHSCLIETVRRRAVLLHECSVRAEASTIEVCMSAALLGGALHSCLIETVRRRAVLLHECSVRVEASTTEVGMWSLTAAHERVR